MIFKIYQVNAFTSEIFKGNPAGVIPNSEGLSVDMMQKISRELNNSETAFIFKPSGNNDFRVRFFTPTVEVPSCGHASLAAAFVWSMENAYCKNKIIQNTSIGNFQMEVEHGKITRYFMNQGQAVLKEIIEGNIKESLLEALGIGDFDLINDLPIQVVSTGHGKVLIPIKSKDTLNKLCPDFNALIRLSDQIGQNGFFLFTMDNSEPGVAVHARMFAPKIGINEDPVTGNGNGPLGAYLVHYKVMPIYDNKLQFIAKQGAAISRSGYAHVIVEVKNDIAINVKVGGECQKVFETQLEIPLESKHVY